MTDSDYSREMILKDLSSNLALSKQLLDPGTNEIANPAIVVRMITVMDD